MKRSQEELNAPTGSQLQAKIWQIEIYPHKIESERVLEIKFKVDVLGNLHMYR